MTDWITHNSKEPPLLAPAALVEHEIWYSSGKFGGIVISRVNAFDGGLWHPGFVYRPLTNDKGFKLISAEGLEEWARWVATDEDGKVWQFKSCPVLDINDDGENIWASANEEIAELASSSHRHPGDYRDSLYRVEGRP